MRRSDLMQGPSRVEKGVRPSKGFVMVALAALCLLAPRMALAESEIVYVEKGPWPGDLTQVSPKDDAFAEPERPGKGIAFLSSVGSVVLSVVTFPVKLVIGVGGAMVGGVAGATTGGDRDAAEGIWNVTTDGSYFVTPEMLEGRERFRLTDED